MSENLMRILRRDIKIQANWILHAPVHGIQVKERHIRALRSAQRSYERLGGDLSRLDEDIARDLQ